MTQEVTLYRRLFNPVDYNIHEFIFTINEVVECIKHFPYFGQGQGPPKYTIIDLVKSKLTCKWKNMLLVQVFDLDIQRLRNFVDF